MADIDVSTLSLPELRALINAASDQAFVLEQQSRLLEGERKVRIAEAVDSLSALLGPEDAAPGMTSIRSVLAYGDTTISQNPGQAVVLILHGLEQMTATLVDMARILSEG